MSDSDIPDAPAPVEEASEQVHETVTEPDPPEPPHTEEVPEWGRTLQETVNGLVSQVSALTPVPPPVDEVVENDDAPVAVPWTHKPIFPSHNYD